jgi:predicted nucleic acid-binding protein
MMFSALLDANVLAPIRLCDILLGRAEAGLYEPLWSDEILAEVERTLVGKFGIAKSKADFRLEQMRKAFPDSSVTDYQGLTSAMTNDPKDRHVLAAAVRAEAKCVVTANIKDFPVSALEPYGIEAIHPDAFLRRFLDESPGAVWRILERKVASFGRPALTLQSLANQLKATVPGFARDIEIHVKDGF